MGQGGAAFDAAADHPTAFDANPPAPDAPVALDALGSLPDAAECGEGLQRDCGSNVGECATGTQVCGSGVWGSCQGDIKPATESCDGLDNDCNDATDEGCPCVAGQTQPCGTDVGVCQIGLQTCAAGNWGGCEGDVVPVLESCATPDDEDCDGAANEGCACQDGATQACGTDIGDCVAGLQTCAAGAWGNCAGETAPAAESCDGSDNDCDGVTDQGCDCQTNDTRPCGTDVGNCVADQQICVAGMWGPCGSASVAPTDEVCNTQDDDCDGATDEGGNACGGICGLSGSPGAACDGADSDACSDDALECSGANDLVCSSGAGNVEVCNGQDDDCVGGCDNAFGCCLGESRACVTACGTPGTETCGAGCGWGACVPAGEICNGQDDDCIGGCDNGFACCQGSSGSCTTSCGSMGNRGCGATCDWNACAPPAEVCNGQDDDCVGGCDNGFACCQGSSAACITTCGSSGMRGCASDCTLDPACAPPGEICNGQDDDCSDGCDNGFGCCLGSTQPCLTGCGSMGLQACGLGCGWDACAPPAELCNGRDDDCDGGCDNGFGCCQGTSGSCTTTCGSTGSRSCASDCSWASCTPPAEICNDIDDNCNTQTDEGVAAPVLSPGLILMFDNACPPGWTEITSAQNRFAMGQDNAMPYAETGGSNHTHGMGHAHSTSSNGYPAHSHTVSTIGPSNTVRAGVDTGCTTCSNPVGAHSHDLSFPIVSGQTAGGNHAHNLAVESAGLGAASDVPAFREVVFCQNSQLGAHAVPAGAISMSRSTCGAGWTEEASFQNRFVRGHDADGQFAEVGGDDSHRHSAIHSHGGTTSNADGFHSHSSGGNTLNATNTSVRFYSVASAAPAHNHAVAPHGSVIHSHTVTAQNPNVTASTELPTYREMAFCKTDAALCPTAGVVGLFDGACPAGWLEVINTRNHLIRGHDGDGMFTESGGVATHTHSIDGHTHSISTIAGHVHPFTTTPLTFPTWLPAQVVSGNCSNCFTYAPFDHTHGGTMTSEGSHGHTIAAGAAFTSIAASGAPAWREFVLCELQ